MTQAALRAMASSALRFSLAISVVFATASCTSATEPTKVATVGVTPNTIARAVGTPQQFVAVAYDSFGNVLAGRTITWSSSNTSVATVSSTGLATGVATGTVTITATSEGQAGTATFSLNPPPVASVAITPVTTSITEIQSVQLAAVTRTSDSTVVTNRPVTWTSSTPAAATISATGLLVGVAPGSTTITATSEGISTSAVIAVTISPCNASVAATIVAGQTVNGTLATSDCFDTVNSAYLDAYKMVITAPTTVDIVMRSTAFDAYMVLVTVDATGLNFQTIGENNNATVGTTDAELTGFVPAGTYYILATSNLTNKVGAYTLSLTSPVIAGVNSNVQLAPLGAESGQFFRRNVTRALIRR